MIPVAVAESEEEEVVEINNCSNSGSGGTVTVSWAANKESAVNTTGGGYVVYYSQASGFNSGDAGVNSKIVPYVTGASAPLSTTITTAKSGSWFIRVAAKSALNSMRPILTVAVKAQPLVKYVFAYRKY